MVNLHSTNTVHGMPFSTHDQNNPPIRHCNSVYNGGWWFNLCSYSYLNGPWKGYIWPWDPAVVYMSDVRGTLMMIRPN